RRQGAGLRRGPAMKRDILDRLLKDRAAKHAVVLVTELPSGAQALVYPQALAPMAALAGYSVTIIDPRRAFATDARFPDVKLLGEWPDEAMATMKLDRRTAVVTLTHDPKLDDPALQTALKADVFYIGALGSRKTHAARLGRLKAAGFSDAECARIHG